MSRGARTCPKCGNGQTVVYETRDEGKQTVRRHQCQKPECAHKFRTVQTHARLEWQSY